MFREIIEHAAIFLQVDGHEEQLLSCANLVIAEVATYYYPLTAKQRVTAADGGVGFSVFDKRVIDVTGVAALSGHPVKFGRGTTRIELPNGEYDIEYTYMPARLGLDDPLPFGDKIGARILALGTACEYCIINSMLDEAAMWDKRYRDAVMAAAQPKGEIRVARRRWK